MPIREAGDSALLLQLEAVIDPAVNARAIGIAAAMRERSVPGVRDVVSTFRSVAVFFDPLSTDIANLAAVLDMEGGAARPRSIGKSVEVPVVYGGDAGPDLLDVAAFAGCSAQEVVERHASRTYRVFMLGFLPGYPYMAAVDETIAVPRLATPRVRVPAGSVAIAGRQTGIYPRESPGGWLIIGRTPVTVFNPAASPPALFAPGDQVRFVPVDPAYVVSGFSRAGVRLKADTTYDAPRTSGAGGRSVTVLRPGLLTTVQDAGRWGHQSLGVPVSGPMDWASHRLANALVGNPRDAATLEVTLSGPELRIEQNTWVAVAGADLQAAVDGVHVATHRAVKCRAGSVVRFGDRRSGARAYIAFDGGIAVPPVLGSRATHLLGGLGAFEGRALRAGDCIPLGAARADLALHRAGVRGGGPAKAGPYMRSDSTSPVVGADLQVGPMRGARLRVLLGPQTEYFDRSALDALQRSRYRVSPESDRMGYRLGGGTPICPASSGDMISDATFVGGLQVPPSGQPILLMADRQTTGGYPQIAVVITADLPLAAQLVPGDWVEFEVCGRSEAIAALVAEEGHFPALD